MLSAGRRGFSSFSHGWGTQPPCPLSTLQIRTKYQVILIPIAMNHDDYKIEVLFEKYKCLKYDKCYFPQTFPLFLRHVYILGLLSKIYKLLMRNICQGGKEGKEGGSSLKKTLPWGGGVVVRVKFPRKMLAPLLLVESQDQFSDWLKDRYTVYTQLVYMFQSTSDHSVGRRSN